MNSDYWKDININLLRQKKIAIIQNELLTYHFPRLETLNEVCKVNEILLISIEVINDYTNIQSKHKGKFVNLRLVSNSKIVANLWKIINLNLLFELWRIKPNCIFLAGYSNLSNLIILLISKLLKVPIVLISDSTYGDKPRKRLIEIFKSKIVKMFNSAFVSGIRAKIYLQMLGFPEDNIFFGNDVVDNNSFHFLSLKISEDKRYYQTLLNLPSKFLLFVGRIVKEKNIENMLNAFKELQNEDNEKYKNFSLVICGTGTQKKYFENYVSNNNIENVIFTGYVSYPEIVVYYSLAHALILPSISETWGLVINEAMSCGLPILASTNVGSVDDLLEENVNGYIFDPNKINEIINSMEKIILTSNEKYYKMQQSSISRIRQYGLERYCFGFLSASIKAIEGKN